MKLSKEELLNSVKSYHDSPSEELYVKMLEDISDSIEDASSELEATITELSAQVEELKQKYINRFFTTEEPEEPEEPEGTEEPEDVEIEELFEEVKE